MKKNAKGDLVMKKRFQAISILMILMLCAGTFVFASGVKENAEPIAEEIPMTLDELVGSWHHLHSIKGEEQCWEPSTTEFRGDCTGSKTIMNFETLKLEKKRFHMGN